MTTDKTPTAHQAHQAALATQTLLFRARDKIHAARNKERKRLWAEKWKERFGYYPRIQA